jgi:Tfp pilus assembly protein PilX
MRSQRTNKDIQGFALILALLLLAVMLVLSIAVFAFLNTDLKVQGGDKQHTVAFYSAEAGMEKLVSDLDQLYSNELAPTASDIQSVGLPNGSPPAIDGTTYTEYTANAQSLYGGAPSSFQSTISTGSEAGLSAQIVPVQLQVTAQRVSGEQVRMIRSVQVASIPIFQYGLFSNNDVILIPGGNWTMGGRVQINGNLIVSATTGNSVTFQSPVRVAKEVVHTTSSADAGAVYFPTATNGCSVPGVPSPTCRALAADESSWLNGTWPYYGFDPSSSTPGEPNPTGSLNPNWLSLSNSTYNDFVESYETGAATLDLPFVQPGVNAVELIRRPLPGELPTSAVGQSREYNKGSIHILLSDDPYDLSPGGPNDPSNIELANVVSGGMNNLNGVALSSSSVKQYFAEGNPATTLNGTETWSAPINPITHTPYPTWSLLSSEFPVDSADAAWSGPGGWLRVEYLASPSATTYTGITQEWLKLGFARQQQSIPNSEVGIQNLVNPNAILVLQETRLPSNNAGLAPAGTSASRNNWYPINFYDTREGEFYGTPASNLTTCALNGIMNVVEIDVRNLSRWLSGAIPGSGTSVDSTAQNGYLVYFSDRRGMLTYPSGHKLGEYGFEDTLNPTAINNLPNNILDLGEDTQSQGEQGYGVLDTYGASDLGQGFGTPLPAYPAGASGANGQRAATRVSCESTAKPNWVSGARHGLRLINGSLGNLPTGTSGGGFSVASENPVYLFGDYNADAAGGSNFNNNGGLVHVSAAIYADKIIALSSNWSDNNSFLYPTNVALRLPVASYYRFAAASGQSADGSTNYESVRAVDFFSMLEKWSNIQFNYKGSLVALFTSRYATGVDQSNGTAQYSAPIRNFSFDSDFQSLSLMPPGTPSLRDVVNAGFQQVF